MRRFVALLSTAAILVACAKPDGRPTDTTKARPASQQGDVAVDENPAKLGETTGLKTPESVRYDPELDVLYVSNINGNPSQHDGKFSLGSRVTKARQRSRPARANTTVSSCLLTDACS
jgi:hypothetical protein